MGKNWIASATRNKGALRAELNAKPGEPIPAKKIEKAAHSDDHQLAQRARLAETLKKLNKK